MGRITLPKQEHEMTDLKQSMERILQEVQPRGIFLVTGERSYQQSGAAEVIAKLLGSYDVVQYVPGSSIPQLDKIQQGIPGVPDNCDLVIAVGGGKVIDTAKAINIFSANIGDPLDYLLKKRNFENPGRSLLAIPTTTGSGSEATHFAVVYVEKVKHSLAHEWMIPNFAILDPRLTLSMPKTIAAASSIDAFCQAIEAFWSVKSTEESKAYSQQAIKLALENIEASVNGGGIEARGKMAQAAHLAGKAINIARTTAPHAFSYSITSLYGVVHGQAVALTLGPILKYNAQVCAEDCNDSRGPTYVADTLATLCGFIGVKNAVDAHVKVGTIMRSIGLETNPKNLGLDGQKMETILAQVNYERLKNNPRRISNETRIQDFFKGY